MYVNGFRRQMPRGRWHLEQDGESDGESEDSQGQSGRV